MALAIFAMTAVLAGCARMEMQQLASKCDFSADSRFIALRGKIPLRIVSRVVV
jgi:hypothetical protein